MVKKPEQVQSVGDRIRKMRRNLNLDIKQLSEKTGYATDYLEEIEDSKVVPPVGALIQISRALAIDTSTLLAEEKRIERRKSYRKRTKAYSYKSLTPDAEDKHLWAYLITLDPQKQHEMVEYRHEGEEFVYVLEGKVEIQVGEEKNILKRGSSLHFNSATAHNLKNLSSKKSLMLVVVYTP